jgi:hypothetical protein
MKTKLQKKKERAHRITKQRNIQGQVHNKLPLCGKIPEIVFCQLPDETAHIEGRHIRNIQMEFDKMWKPACIAKEFPAYAAMLERIQFHGIDKALETHHQKRVDQNESFEESKDNMAHALNNMLEEFGHDVMRQIRTYNDKIGDIYLNYKIVGKQIIVQIKSPVKVVTPYGILYHSSQKHAAHMNGEYVMVAWSAHARIRMRERLEGHNGNVITSQNIERHIEENTYFPLTRLPNGEPAIELWVDGCRPTKCPDLVRQATGGEFKLGDQCKIKLGYCPLKIEKDMLVVKSVLSPGMEGTPEWGVLQDMGLSDITPTFSEMSKKNDYHLLKKFQEAGFIQVKRLMRLKLAS